MIDIKEMVSILKKYHQRYFTTKQAISDYILENHNVDYTELKYRHENIKPLVKKVRRSIYTVLRDMEKAGTIERQSQITWRFVK